MNQTLIESYQWDSRPRPVEVPTYSKFTNDTTGKEVRGEQITRQVFYRQILEDVNLQAVYVNEDTNELVYHSRLMEKGKKYHVEWCGEHFLLIRNDDGVVVYVREEDDE